MSVKKHSFKVGFEVFNSGGMPSAHTAVIVSITTMIGLIDGLSSGLFALAVASAAIVIHDAMRVRKSTGEQGIIINQIIKERKYDIKELRISKGHTPLEVFFGLLLGIVISLIVFLAT